MKNKIKLAMVTPFPERPGVITGGVEGVARCLTTGLRRNAELDIHIIAPCSIRSPGIEKRDGVTIHWLKKSRVPGFLAYWSLFRIAIHRRLKQIAPDITHFQGIAGWALGYNNPYVLTIHGISEKDVLYTNGYLKKFRHNIIRLAEKNGRLRSSDIILISPYVLREIGNHLPGRHWSIENPIEDDFFQIRRKKFQPIILFVGRISRRKNIHTLIKSFAIVEKLIPNAFLQLGGSVESNAYLEECNSLVHRFGLSSKVQFHGNLDRQQLGALFSKAACLVLVSYQETAPMIVEEGMASGVPIIASRVGGLPEMVEDGVTGFLVEPDNPEEIAEKIVRLLQDEMLNNVMSFNSRCVARERFHVDNVAIKTMSVYKQILHHTTVE